MFKREDAGFPAGSVSCAAWLYRPDSAPVSAATEAGAPCVVMAHGFSLTRHEGLDAYAERLAAAGASVLAFAHGGELRCPALVVWGQDDPYIGLPEAERYARILPHARLCTVPGVGHWPFREEPSVIDEIIAFLST
jgi:pimeloyl-ACP methyl ester carboxylesterase